MARRDDGLHVGDRQAVARGRQRGRRPRRCSGRRSGARPAPTTRPARSFTAASICVASRSMVARSAPATLMPTGLLMPVASMSMRLRIGGTQTLRQARHLAPRGRAPRPACPASCPARHWSRGLNWMVVSNISSGAGSVAVSARPALPNTRSTSGTVLISRSVCCSSSRGLGRRQPGQRRRHVQQVALVERRHELAAEAQHRDGGQRQDDGRDDQRRLRKAQHRLERRPVDARSGSGSAGCAVSCGMRPRMR